MLEVMGVAPPAITLLTLQTRLYRSHQCCERTPSGELRTCSPLVSNATDSVRQFQTTQRGN